MTLALKVQQHGFCLFLYSALPCQSITVGKVQVCVNKKKFFYLRKRFEMQSCRNKALNDSIEPVHVWFMKIILTRHDEIFPHSRAHATILGRNVSNFTEAYWHQWNPSILACNATDKKLLCRCTILRIEVDVFFQSFLRKTWWWSCGDCIVGVFINAFSGSSSSSFAIPKVIFKCGSCSGQEACDNILFGFGTINGYDEHTRHIRWADHIDLQLIFSLQMPVT